MGQPSASRGTALATDVLVLGAGGAGLRAALEAARAGARVTVVSKLDVDEPNCTVAAWGGMTYCPENCRDELFRQIVETGGFLSNQRLVEVFVRDTPARLRELSELGACLDVLDGADQAQRLGMVKIRGQGRTTGFGLTRPLRAAAAALGVTFLDRVMVTALVKRGPRVTGALAVNLADGAILGLAAKAIVVATGGGACLYGRTDNPAGTTADGIALAYGAGADLVDLECVSFFFPESRLPELFAVEDPPAAGLLEVGAAHYFLGGIRIDERCRTTVPGLFAAGEATGGLFGAARLGGTAMADTIVFGAIAGREAALDAGRRQACPAIPTSRLLAARGSLETLGSGCGPTPEVFAAGLGELMWTHGGTMKTAASLHHARRELAALSRGPGPAARGLCCVRQAIECRFMLTVARLIVAASLLREETRGCFWRLDHPGPRNRTWLANIVLRRTRAGMQYETRPAVMTRLTTAVAPRIGAGCFPYLPFAGVSGP